MNPLRAFYKQQAQRVSDRRRGKLPRPPKPKSLRPLERANFRLMHPVLKTMKEAVDTVLLPAMPAILAKNYRADDMAFDIKQVTEQLEVFYKRRLTPDEIRKISARLAQNTYTYTQANVAAHFQTVLGVNAMNASPAIATELALATEENVALITSISEKYFADIKAQVFDHVRRGDNVRELEAKLQERYNVSESRAALIARDQTSKLNGVLTEVEHTSLGITSYVWRTASDARVRDYHAELDGQVFSYDDPPVIRKDGTKGNPGIDFNCRCFAEPNFGSLLED